MDYIHPHERYNQHDLKQEFDEARLIATAKQMFGTTESVRFKRLSGGFQNTNYLATCGNECYVFRYYSSGREAFERESSILRFLSDTSVNAPNYIGSSDCIGSSDYIGSQTSGTPNIVLEYVHGRPFQELLLEHKHLLLGLFEKIGRELAQVHSIVFDDAGFIGRDMSIGNEYESLGAFAKDYILEVFNRVPVDRLSKDDAQRICALVKDKWHFVEQSDGINQLCHCDFNPKNLLVSLSDNSVSIIDWEFGLSGNGLVDLGNFFRFSYDYPDGAEAALIRGYSAVRGGISKNWKEASKLLDLANMASFLEREEHYAKTFRTAKSVVHSTLDFFAY